LLQPLTDQNVFPASVFKLNNGLSVIHQYIPTTPVVVADIWVRAGALIEPEPWFGMAHFLEHMIFKGTNKLLPGVFDSKIENQGGVSNAATSHDYAHYFVTTAAPYLQDTLPHLAELLLNAAIPDAEFDRERDVVLEEIRQAEDDPDWQGYQALSQSVYQDHPYGRSVLGTEKELMQQSPSAMRRFHRTHYQPENMTVVIVGGVRMEPALELVSQAFANFADKSDCPPSVVAPEPVISGICRQTLHLPRLEQARLLMAWTTPGISDLRTAYGLDLLSVLLAEGRTSRLLRDLREEQHLVQDISSNYALQRESSLFTISAWLETEDLEQVEAKVCAHLDNLQTQPISEMELNRCKRLLCNDYAFSTETPNQLTGLYGYYQTIAEASLAIKYPQQIQSLTATELQDIASKYLSPHNYAVTVVRPE